MSLAFFHAEGDQLIANDMARSLWSHDQMHGVAIGGAVARALEMTLNGIDRGDLRAARYNVDMFKAVSMTLPCEFRGRVVREGPRIALIDAELIQDGEPRCRATGLFLKPSENPDGELWTPEHDLAPPPPEAADESDERKPPVFYSETEGWSSDFMQHQNGSRKIVWQTALPVVEDEEVTPFQAACSAADTVTLATNWGAQGVQHINTDVVLSLSRAPYGRELGFAALTRSETDGIASGSCVVYDRRGVLGSAITTSLANARRTVDFTRVEIPEDGSAARRI
ncbi:MAG TPA: thioesterase family protein [Marmoricola sp.]|nr:thioesterase family protein [Marmoricola sp.]HMY08617.1 thioesterase family protein [Marmoricola sp.]